MGELGSGVRIARLALKGNGGIPLRCAPLERVPLATTMLHEAKSTLAMTGGSEGSHRSMHLFDELALGR
jgi:hypothetical protein